MLLLALLGRQPGVCPRRPCDGHTIRGAHSSSRPPRRHLQSELVAPIASPRDVGPCTLLGGEGSDPVGIIARSASSIVPDFRRDRSLPASRLSLPILLSAIRLFVLGVYRDQRPLRQNARDVRPRSTRHGQANFHASGTSASSDVLICI